MYAGLRIPALATAIMSSLHLRRWRCPSFWRWSCPCPPALLVCPEVLHIPEGVAHSAPVVNSHQTANIPSRRSRCRWNRSCSQCPDSFHEAANVILANHSNIHSIDIFNDPSLIDNTKSSDITFVRAVDNRSRTSYPCPSKVPLRPYQSSRLPPPPHGLSQKIRSTNPIGCQPFSLISCLTRQLLITRE